QYLLQKIENYKKEKRDLLEQKLLLFQSIEQELKTRLENINKCINTYTDMSEKKNQLRQLLQDDNNCTLDFDFVQMIEQLLKQYVVIVESGQITLGNVKIKEDSKSHVNPIVSLSCSIESIENELKGRSFYELEVTKFNHNKDLERLEIFKQIPGQALSNGTIEIDEFSPIILTNQESKLLLSYLPQGLRSKLVLLYQGSRDGFDPTDFHQTCDNKGKTVTIIMEECNHVFGGFTNAKWYSSRGVAYSKDGGAFVYLLRNNSSRSPQKWNIKPSQSDYAICNHLNYGPSFEIKKINKHMTQVTTSYWQVQTILNIFLFHMVQYLSFRLSFIYWIEKNLINFFKKEL
ncbi:hypothetical protein RFI_32947, partial [Reticulomyxa filosa]